MELSSSQMITFIRRRWTPTGGAENYLNRLACRMQQKGIKTRLICESWQSSQTFFDEITELKISGASHTYPKKFADQTNELLKKMGQEKGIVFSMERGIQADIYRAGDGVHRVWLEKRAAQNPFLGTLRNFFNAKNKIVLALENFTFQPENTRCVIANSEMVKRDILSKFQYPQNQIEVVLNGVDIAFFSSGNRQNGRKVMGWDDDKVIFLLVGAGKERKGHRIAQEVVAKIGKKAELAIVDQSPSCSMPDVYAGADVFLLPTLYDPFANVTLEAMAAGLPVITTATNGGSQIIKSGCDGYVVSHSYEIETFVSLGRELLDEEFRLRMGKRAQEKVKEFTLEKNVEYTLEVVSKR